MHIAILFLILFVGIVLLSKGADVLVSGSSNLALSYGVPLLIISLIIVSLGTSLPELFVSALSSAQDEKDIALGNVIGSNVANILLVLGVASLIRPVKMKDPLADREILILGLVTSIMFFFIVLGGFSLWVGIAFIIGYLIYLISLLKIARNERIKAALESEAIEEIEDIGVKKERPLISWLKVILGFAGVLIGSEALIYSAVGIAEFFSIPSGIIALSLVAIGTSLPELATVVVASLRGSDAVSIGTIIGSNNFNILVVLGVAILIAPITTGAGMVTGGIFAVIAFFIMTITQKLGVINRIFGAVMLFLYAIYIAIAYGVKI
jgi:cation:H+ antiporter